MNGKFQATQEEDADHGSEHLWSQGQDREAALREILCDHPCVKSIRSVFRQRQEKKFVPTRVRRSYVT